MKGTTIFSRVRGQVLRKARIYPKADLLSAEYVGTEEVSSHDA